MSVPTPPHTPEHKPIWRHVLALKTVPSGRVYGPYEICEVCGSGVVLIAQPTVGHPDSTPLPQLDADDALLARYDAELFPSEVT